MAAQVLAFRPRGTVSPIRSMRRVVNISTGETFIVAPLDLGSLCARLVNEHGGVTLRITVEEVSA